MFNLSGSEIIVILLLALVVLGPDKLPDAMRKAGRTFAELKKLSSGFQDEVRRGFEEPTKEVKKTAAAVRSAATFTGADTSSVKDKPRYNPAVDAPPELPAGSSVAEPATRPVPVVDAAEAAPVVDVVVAEAEAATDEPVGAANEPDGVTEAGQVVDEATGEAATATEADSTT